MASSSTRPDNLRWSDLEDEEDNGEEIINFLLLPTQVIGPDKNGIKQVIKHELNEQGSMVKIRTTSRVRNFETRTKKQFLERRSWPKFGDAVNESVGAMLTVVSTEKIFLERPNAQGSGTKAGETGEDSLGQAAGNEGGLLMVCRTCGKKGDHWTARCPYKNLITTEFNLNDRTLSDAAENHVGSSSGIGNSSRYIPPSQRTGADQESSYNNNSNNNSGASDMRYRNHENKVKVSNLSEHAGKEDLRELFSAFGQINSVYVASDRNGLSRGFGFVSFVRREDAQRAIDKLNGYGYDHLILAVEWAPPRSK